MKNCELHSSYNSEHEAIAIAHELNLTVPDGEPKWIISETIKNVRWAVVRFTGRTNHE